MSRARNIHEIVQIAYTCVREMAKKEGPDGEKIFRLCEITADFERGKGRCRLQLQFGREVVWTGYANVDQESVTFLPDDELVARIMAPIRDSMSLVGQKVFVDVHTLFPNSVRKVDVEYDVERAERKFAVRFLNGHVAEVMESELGTDVFRARCSMLYDLPPL